MTSAELKTIREAIGLAVPELAAIAGVQERTVRYWESGHTAVPKDVAEKVLAIDDHLTKMATRAANLAREVAAAHGGHMPSQINLLRYRENADLWHYQPEFRPLPATTHAACLARTRAALADLHVASRIIFLDVPAYVAWLAGRADNASLRAQWAGEQ